MPTGNKPPRFRAVGTSVLDSMLGDGETPIILAKNSRHAVELAKCLNAYETGYLALRAIVEEPSCSPPCCNIAMDAMRVIDEVITHT